MRNQCIAVVVCAGAALAQTAAATVVYDGNGGWTGSNALLINAEWADDVHMTDAGTLTRFTIAYTQSTATSGTVRFYTNNATNTDYPGPATLLAEYPGLPMSGGGASGTIDYAVPLALQVDLPADVWMSIETNGQINVRLQGGALVGASDIHRTTVPGFGDYNFDFPGNFPFTVEVDPVPAPATAGLLVTAAIAGLRRRR
mgnify:CR=1 FL=1